MRHGSSCGCADCMAFHPDRFERVNRPLTQPVMLSASEWATAIVRAIIYDLSDRRGLRHEWDQIDDDIKEEIRKQWTSIVLKVQGPPDAVLTLSPSERATIVAALRIYKFARVSDVKRTDAEIDALIARIEKEEREK
jgi:hypothetical protein